MIQDKQLLDRASRTPSTPGCASSSPCTRTRRGRSRRAREPDALRVLCLRCRAGLSPGEPVRDRQRAEPARVLAPTVHALWRERVRGGVRAVPRGCLRRPEGDDPAIQVVGIGLSPRGNDKPKAKSNVSTSPVRFLRALGAWYRASGRTRPLMDSFSFHPYPNRATDPLDRGYGWPNAGFVNLDRIKLALWDAFNGTAQPTTLNGLGSTSTKSVGRSTPRGSDTRARERARDGRVHAGRDLRRSHPPLRLRAGPRRGELLRVPRRRPAHRIPGRAPAGGRHPRPAVDAVRARSPNGPGCQVRRVSEPGSTRSSARRRSFASAEREGQGLVPRARRRTQKHACRGRPWVVSAARVSGRCRAPRCVKASVGPGSPPSRSSLPTGGDVRAEVTVAFTAVSNPPSRPESVEHELSTRRSASKLLDNEHVFAYARTHVRQ